MTVRAFYEAAKVEGAQAPYDTLHLKVFYPAQMSGSHLEKDMGVVPVDPTQAPFPVVIFFNGFNCDAQRYQWLAVELAERGLVVVIYNWVAEQVGMIGLTAGVDVEAGNPPFMARLRALQLCPQFWPSWKPCRQKGFWRERSI